MDNHALGPYSIIMLPTPFFTRVLSPTITHFPSSAFLSRREGDRVSREGGKRALSDVSVTFSLSLELTLEVFLAKDCVYEEGSRVMC